MSVKTSEKHAPYSQAHCVAFLCQKHAAFPRAGSPCPTREAPGLGPWLRMGLSSLVVSHFPVEFSHLGFEQKPVPKPNPAAGSLGDQPHVAQRLWCLKPEPSFLHLKLSALVLAETLPAAIPI